MPDLVETFNKWKTKLADTKKSKRRDRYGERVTKLKHSSDGHVTIAPPTQEYLENYETTFGHK